MTEPGFTEHRFVADDGLRLYAREYGHIDGALPVVCLPGLTRNSRDFHRFAAMLAHDPRTPRRVFTFDYRGRGQSAFDSNPQNYRLDVEARDVVTACRHLGLSQAIFIGTSRGGLILHLLAGMMPDLLRGVILNDIGPVIEIDGLLAIRHYLEKQEALSSWTAAVENLRRVHGVAFPALDDSDWDDMARAIFREDNGRIIADYDLAVAEPLKAITPESRNADLWPIFENFLAIPLMTIRGENSTILSEATVRSMADRHPAAIAVTATGQGHAPLLHRPDIYEAIGAFLGRIG